MKKSEEPEYQRQKRAPQFAAVKVDQTHLVYRGSQLICRAVISHTMARRIANALNQYKPGPKGY